MLSFSVDTAWAEVEAQKPVLTILSIDVEGVRYVEKEMVLSKMGSKVGQPLRQKQLSKDVRRLHKTGFFSDVRFAGTRTAEGIHLVCKVTEYPLIASVSIQGNDEQATKDLQQRMKLRPGRIFSPNNQDSDRNMIRKGYLKDGFYQVDVQFIATPKSDGRVDLVVKIFEGEVTHIRRIRFIGNKAFSDSRLRDEILTRASNFPAWFSDKDVFDQRRFGADAQLLQQFYLNNGYLDFQIESTQINMTADKTAFNLAFNIHEGEQYTVVSVDIQGDQVPDRDTLLELLEVEAGETYGHAEMIATIEALTARVGDEGHAYASVTPIVNRNLEERTVTISFDIDKGEEVYVERIEITGNAKTEDAVIRRMIKQSEGSRYSGSQVQVSKDAVKRSNFVEDMRVSFPKGSAPDKANMMVNVKEKRTGSLSGGIGYSSQEKVTITGKVTEENLFGKGYQASLNGEYGKITQNISASLTDPYFINDNISASINVFNTQTDPYVTTTYRTKNLGGGVAFGIPITHELSYGIGYQYNRTDLEIVGAVTGVSLFVQAQQGRQTIGEVTQRLTWDSRDRALAPTSGNQTQLAFGVSGLGGNYKFYEASFQSDFFFSFGNEDQFTLNPSFTTAMIRGYSNSNVPLYRRYSLGGVGSLRGFDSYGVSLRDATTNEPVGGDKQTLASVNLFFPIPYMETKGIRGLVFADAGTMWGSVDATVGATAVNVTEAFSLSRVRYSAGLGFEWMSPIGPVGMAWSFPIRKMPGDVEKSFEFVLGTSF